jgi:phosphomevalonate kinase
LQLLTVTAPANLLVLGEYAVLEEGGMGLAIAPEIRVAAWSGNADPGPVSARAAHGAARVDSARVTGLMPGRTVHWPGDAGLLGKVADHLQAALPVESIQATVDSSAYFDDAGRKLGLGSSAAMTVALSALWLAEAGKISAGATMDANEVFQLALRAHREGQGGGSGYDVAASTFGGALVFTGGSKPGVETVTLPWLPDLNLVHGPAPVKTISAVTRYREWKSNHRAAARQYVRESNRLIMEFVAAPDWQAGRQILVEYRERATGLGKNIGVPAELGSGHPGSQAPGGEFADLFGKAVGAGNETGLVFGGPSGEPPGPDGDMPHRERGRLQPITLSEVGVSWR